MRCALALAAALAFCLAGQGCARIRIHNKSGNPKTLEPRSERYTTAVFGAYDVSGPVDLSNRCKDGWQDIVTETTFTQAFLKAVTLDLYSPWRLEISCLAPKPKVKTEPF